MSDKQTKINELKAKIAQNERMRDKAYQLKPLLTDRNALSQCETEIKECQKYIDYFTEELAKIESRNDTEDDVVFHDTNTTSGRARTNSVGATEGNMKKYSTLDLLTTETLYNKSKVSMKLHELEYKLDVENKVLAGIKTMADVLDKDTSINDRKRRSELQGQMYESIEKLNLLTKALRKYKSLYIGEGDDEDDELETPPSSRMPPGFRRPVTGKLQLELIQARGLAHAPTRMFKAPDTIVYVKIDGNIVFRSKLSRNDTWVDMCETHVNKATEVEISIYDQEAERSLPIGIFWLKITDIAEGLRKKKIQQENGSGWVPADVYQKQEQQDSEVPEQQVEPKRQDPTWTETTEDGIQAWFDVEPSGEMLLRVNFVREAANRRPLDKLGRAGAVRQRREEVHEMNGHQFFEKKFYNIMRCALCGEFLVNSGYQCEDCEYTCHKKCYTKVVTKCISKSNADKDADEDKLNHRIPHRFEPITNIGANWCCHCGYMLPLGSKGAKKCLECGITCHTKCQLFIPDFCGLSMEMANQMLAEIKAANKRKTLDTKPNRTTHPELSDAMSQLSMKPLPLQPSPPPPVSPVNRIQPSTPPPVVPPHAQPYVPQQQQQYPIQTNDPRYQSYAMRPPQLTPTSPYHQSPSSTNSSPQMRPVYQQPHGMEIARPPIQLKPTQQQQQQRRVTLNDFNFLFVLGKGNFGKVMLAEDKYDKRLYAVKVLKKRFIIDNDEIESLRSEKRILQAANRARHPFLVSLQSCFQTESRVYFVMEYVSGGDLMWHIQREPFSERRAKFYACEVLLALEYFHSQGIIYRDLKLDNIMLGLDGHIKVTDYGLCKENMWYEDTTGTFCGTPEFMAPEILLEQKYGRAVDWWAFGVLVYEMLLGQSPFRGEDEDEIFDAILEDEILYPVNMSRDSVSICQRLLNRDPKRRLGAGPSDAAEIKEHPFFHGVNWDDMLNKRVPPPFCPTITSPLDTSNFDEEFTRERPALTPINSVLNRVEQQEFQNFSYVADFTQPGSLW
ncbi:kinase-like domain-containing protein [Gilbertella persicaria]|uniref:kinase-like domain-containing protein n=1 Tax=Gilbertella persicaria TaxID=101096 RepID=UPI00221F46F6|nr:kinase-like domain-containing protein [Gilbertella persicaria]KAI8087822.1 kinase-like domain-containing protein [Gilbertella persicaria]